MDSPRSFGKAARKKRTRVTDSHATGTVHRKSLMESDPEAAAKRLRQATNAVQASMATPQSQPSSLTSSDSELEPRHLSFAPSTPGSAHSAVGRLLNELARVRAERNQALVALDAARTELARRELAHEATSSGDDLRERLERIERTCSTPHPAMATIAQVASQARELLMFGTGDLSPAPPSRAVDDPPSVPTSRSAPGAPSMQRILASFLVFALGSTDPKALEDLVVRVERDAHVADLMASQQSLVSELEASHRREAELHEQASGLLRRNEALESLLGDAVTGSIALHEAASLATSDTEELAALRASLTELSHYRDVEIARQSGLQAALRAADAMRLVRRCMIALPVAHSDRSTLTDLSTEEIAALETTDSRALMMQEQLQAMRDVLNEQASRIRELEAATSGEMAAARQTTLSLAEVLRSVMTTGFLDMDVADDLLRAVDADTATRPQASPRGSTPASMAIQRGRRHE